MPGESTGPHSMTAAEVARHLYAPRRALAGSLPGAECVELGGGFLTVDRSSTAKYPSTNRNRAEFIGVTRPASRGEVEEIVERFAAAGVRRWFFWLSPCPQMEEIRRWLPELGLRPFDGPRYITLARSAEAVAPHETALRVRALTAPELHAHTPFLTELHGDFAGAFLGTIGRDDCLHYLAFDGDRPVAASGLCVAGAAGYLFLAATREADRSRGAQNALIAARVRAAHARGCRIVMVETLSLLRPSLANLVRQGFRECYDTQVFVCAR